MPNDPLIQSAQAIGIQACMRLNAKLTKQRDELARGLEETLGMLKIALRGMKIEPARIEAVFGKWDRVLADARVAPDAAPKQTETTVPNSERPRHRFLNRGDDTCLSCGEVEGESHAR